MTRARHPRELPPETLEAIRRAAEEDHESVINLTQALVRVPSQGGIDPYEPIIELLEEWLDDRGLPHRRLHGPDQSPVGLVVEIEGADPHSRYVLDACLDTAPFGDLDAWEHPPTSGEIVDGWLYGRGSADCKSGVAIFSHIAARLQQQRDRLQSGVTMLFDADEHTGRFGGVRAFLEQVPPAEIAGVMIGYPGMDKIVIGGRGFLRAELVVHGIADHSGGNRPSAGNAIAKAARLVEHLNAAPLPAGDDQDEDGFTVPPKLTVTAIHGGEPTGSYTIVPDRCTVHVDIRLTQTFDQAAAVELLKQAAFAVDEQWPDTKPVLAVQHESWPAYRLSPDSPLSTALAAAAERATGSRPPFKIAGPSNIGNYLAAHNIPATAGFGVRYRDLHAADEAIDIATFPTAYATYQDAILTLAPLPS